MTDPDNLRELAAEAIDMAVCTHSVATIAALIDLAQDYWTSACYYERS